MNMKMVIGEARALAPNMDRDQKALLEGITRNAQILQDLNACTSETAKGLLLAELLRGTRSLEALVGSIDKEWNSFSRSLASYRRVWKPGKDPKPKDLPGQLTMQGVVSPSSQTAPTGTKHETQWSSVDSIAQSGSESIFGGAWKAYHLEDIPEGYEVQDVVLTSNPPQYLARPAGHTEWPKCPFPTHIHHHLA